MLTFLLFSFHKRRTRGPRKMIFFVFVIINPLSQCVQKIYSQNYYPYLAWGLVIGLAEVFKAKK